MTRNRWLAFGVALLTAPTACEREPDPQQEVEESDDSIILGHAQGKTGVSDVKLTTLVGGKEQLRCSGTLLAPGWVLTAGHCSGAAKTPDAITVIHGDTKATRKGARWEKFPSEDVGLLRLETPFALTDVGNGRLFPGDALSLEGLSVPCYGYGQSVYGSVETAGKLRYAELTLTSVTPSTYVTLPNEKKQIQWYGDSGSSCYVKRNGRLTMAGVQSRCNHDEKNKKVTRCISVNSAFFRDWANLHAPTPFEDLGGEFLSGVAATSWSVGRLDLVGVGSNGAMWHNFFVDGSGWAGWRQLGNTTFTADTPAAVSWQPGRLDIIARRPDRAYWHSFWTDSTGWSEWRPLGGDFAAGPAAVSWGPGRLDVVGVDQSGTLLYQYWEDAADRWSGWTPIGAPFSAHNPAITSWGPGRLDVVARRPDSTVALNSWTPATRWGGWQGLNGSISSGPAVVAMGVEHLHIYGRGPQDRLWHRVWRNGWSEWVNDHDGTISSTPAAVKAGDRRIHVFARSPSTTMLHAYNP